MLTIIIRLLLGYGLLLGNAYAETLSVEQEVSILKEVEVLFNQAHYQEAALKLSPVRNKQPVHLQALFLSGQIYAATRRWEQAAQEYRLMLKQDKTLLRPRLELAYALYRQGHFAESLAQFRLAKESGGLPQGAEETVTAYIHQLSRRETSWQVGVGVIFDDNANQATSSQEFVFAGMAFKINPGSRKTASQGGLLQLGWQKMLGESWQDYVRINLELTDYAGHLMDTAYGSAVVGTSGRFVDGLRFEVGAHQMLFQGRTLFSGPIASAEWKTNLGEQWQVGAVVNVQDMTYPDFSYLTSTMQSLGLSASYVPSDNLMFNLSLTGAEQNAHERPYSNRSNSIEAGASWLKSDVLTAVHWNVRRVDYLAADPFLGFARKDSSQTWLLDVSKPDWLLWGFNPQLQMAATTNDSNSSLHAYTRKTLKLMFRRSL